MKALGNLLSRGRPGERDDFSAAFILGAVNEELIKIVSLSPADARAQSFAHGEVIIHTSHGAVAGLIQQAESEIIRVVNKKLQNNGRGPSTIKKILTRPGKQR